MCSETGFGHDVNFCSVFVSFYFRIGFSGSECLLSFLCALSRLLSSFPVMLSAPLLLGEFFFFLSNAFPVASHALSPFRGFSRRRCGSLGTEPHSPDLHFHCRFIPFQTGHSSPLKVCMFHFHCFCFIFDGIFVVEI